MDEHTIIILAFCIAFVIAIYFFQKKNNHKEIDVNPFEEFEIKFNYLINGINQYCYSGYGVITYNALNSLSIYRDGSSQIVYIKQIGSLFITWKIKYFHHEMTYSKMFNPTDDFSQNEQQYILHTIVKEFLYQYENHKRNVDRKLGLN